MLKVRIKRDREDEDGTFGILTVTKGSSSFVCCTGELPWRNNAANSSCIPKGVYRALIRDSSRGRRYGLLAVPDRAGILIHSGNWCGDKSLGKKTDSEGCILLGSDFAIISNQKAISDSRRALAAFEAFCAGEEIEVTIL